jgi:hypothetical protein
MLASDQGGWGDPDSAVCSVALPAATHEALLVLLSSLWYCLDSSRWPWLTAETQPPLVHARVRRSVAAVVFRLVRPQVGNLVALLRRMILQFIDAPLQPSASASPSPPVPLPAGPKTALVVLTTALTRVLTLHTTVLAPLVLSSSSNVDAAPASWWDPAADISERTLLLAELAPPKSQPQSLQALSTVAASGDGATTLYV